ncbi:hypothetical protein BS50DRAFT_598583 [Corynespora cassiicola Philippines]|uniref:Pentatricopeptide repeat protein n=1 Tax=Corynespora cassiicola Philippines TaxID=1448308 RepID=A0A2T2NXA0_CORCC|nr:hypothetical protein BS50DRAFT_598583 [Corynespora cassiicola Philippines]
MNPLFIARRAHRSVPAIRARSLTTLPKPLSSWKWKTHINVTARIKHLESRFLNGNEEEAIITWEDDHAESNPESRYDYEPAHLELGARIHALAGNVDRSREIMEELFDLYPSWDTAVMLTVFRAHTSSTWKQHHDTAKDIYSRMKSIMGNKIILEDYDAWFVGFLEAKNIRYAKQVFRDMVKAGHLASHLSDAEALKVLKRLNLLYRLGTDIQKMTTICLHAISVLPMPYHSYLYGDWMSSALVQNSPETATQILQMLVNRGYQATSYHFNILLRVLLRSKDQPHVLQAENIGWRMIEEARKSHIDAGPEHASETTGDTPDELTIFDATVRIPDAATRIPRANPVTFGLIMRHHADHGQWEHVDYLKRRLQDAEIAPNCTIMNVLMDNYCRKGDYHQVWRTYKELTQDSEGRAGLFPDGMTMRCLWVSLRLALGSSQQPNSNSLPSPRELLAETVQWWTLVRSRYDAERFRMGLAAESHGAVTSLMMHCFSYAKDFPGSLVALHALKDKFGIWPTEKAIEILQRQAAWFDQRDADQSLRAHHGMSVEENLDRMRQVFQILEDRRLEGMGITRYDYAHMSVDELRQLDLNLLSEFVRVLLKREHTPAEVEHMIDEAKSQIGLPGLLTGDLDAFSVA